jgi:hypothetical protein
MQKIYIYRRLKYYDSYAALLQYQIITLILLCKNFID